MFRQIVGMTVLCALAALIATLLVAELRAWLSARRDPSAAGRARRRFIRRGVGAALLLAALVLLAVPPASTLTPAGQMKKMLVCMSICAAVILIAIRDLRVMRAETREEMADLAAKSARDLRSCLKDATPPPSEERPE